MKSFIRNKAWLMGFVFSLAIIAMTPASILYSQESLKSDLEIRYLSKGKKVIPVECQIGTWKIVDIKLPDLFVTNTGKNEITID